MASTAMPVALGSPEPPGMWNSDLDRQSGPWIAIFSVLVTWMPEEFQTRSLLQAIVSPIVDLCDTMWANAPLSPFAPSLQHCIREICR